VFLVAQTVIALDLIVYPNEWLLPGALLLLGVLPVGRDSGGRPLAGEGLDVAVLEPLGPEEVALLE
jgi:hypothetical protein